MFCIINKSTFWNRNHAQRTFPSWIISFGAGITMCWTYFEYEYLKFSIYEHSYIPMFTWNELLQNWLWIYSRRGVTHVLTLFVTIGGAIVAIAGFLFTCVPSEFMIALHAFVGTIIKNSAIAGFLSSLKFIGKFLSVMVDTHKDVPEVCATVCK